MTPPEAPLDETFVPGNAPPAVSVRLQILRKRSDFLRAARAGRYGTSGMMVQGRRRGDDEPDGIRVGFTCSKKVGNAVARNRAKRRLRHVAQAVLPQTGREGWDYVLIGKPGATALRPYEDLIGDLRHALRKLHQPK